MAQQPAPFDDLSTEIAQQVERQPMDEVRVTHLYGSKYRCNWWCREGTGGYDNPKMRGGQLATTHRIRKSQFLHATRVDGQVVITPLRQD